MSNFTTKTQKPSAREYLDASLDDVVERLNNNPAGLQSEEALIHAVLTVRLAKINESLSQRLNFLTAILAFATICLVVVSFLVPSLEKQQLVERINQQSQLIEQQKININHIAETVSALKKGKEEFKEKMNEHNKPLLPTQKPHG